MSGKSSSALMVVFMAAIALAAQKAEENASNRQAARGPAAVMIKKEQILGSVERPLLRHTEKLNGPVEPQIELVGARPELAGDVFVLKGIVTSPETINDVEFKWSLPEGVELINGQLSGRFAVIEAGKPSEVELTLKSLTGENHQVSFIAGASRGGTRFAQSVQYNTLLEPLIESSRKELAKSTKDAADEAQSQDGKRIKIYH